MKTVLHVNKSGQHSFITEVNAGQPMAIALIKAWNELPLVKIDNPAKLRALYETDTWTFAADMVPEKQQVKLMGVALKPARVVELMDLDFTAVEQAKNNAEWRCLMAFLNVAKVTKGYALEVDKTRLDEALEGFVTYAANAKQEKAAELYRVALDAVRQLVDMGAPAALFDGDWLTRIEQELLESPRIYNFFKT